MRKSLRMLLLGAVFTVLLCTSALAAGNKGICDVSDPDKLTPQKADTTPVDSTTPVGNKQVYLNSERVQLAYSGAVDGTEYLVVVLEDADSLNPVPAANNIVYIDQKSGTAANSGFNLYPSRLTSGKTYSVYVSDTNNGLTPQGSFSYYADYMLGDVNGDNTITATDSLIALQIAAFVLTPTETQSLAADTNRDNVVTAADSLLILQAAAFLITLE